METRELKAMGFDRYAKQAFLAKPVKAEQKR
jgi:hypothetical protein